ncbi:methyltransferase [Methylobacterium gnaphalii]|uniref:SAM-dependent methyltransferase n=1 Tax=Methylobacterium gnaphalii TaxID=1010610 RepID=A0A512JQM7_9HYPH|nr:class I SAM-dependent methyltransferase [Methylobacterium gnaphalii]GEP12242.1 SAM-dependent methyltransferase [Methylobacterium gnaphalii]GJD70561.1 Release factor glutamine methyltransferase [Methylobacterium gnaphalii]GLS48519.1 SAM-dependent methyltransferase [Methylobacterium gnaphalii]
MMLDQHETTQALVELVQALREDGYAFTTVTPASHAHVNRRPGNERARSIRDVFGWSRPFDEGLLPSRWVALMRRANVLAEGADGLRSTIRVSSLDGELFVHSAYPPEAEDAVFFGPDTARFVSAVIGHLDTRTSPLRRAVDIGCGSGAAGIAVAKRAPDAEVVLVDVNPAALRLAGVNAKLAAVTVEPRQSNLLSAVEGSFDLIVSNPPFMVDRLGRAYRHGGGAAGEGLSLAVVEAAAERLAPGGSLVLFTGAVIVDGEDAFRKAATAVCERAGLDWAYREFDSDAYGEELADPAYAKADRIALVVLTATRRHQP